MPLRTCLVAYQRALNAIELEAALVLAMRQQPHAVRAAACPGTTQRASSDSMRSSVAATSPKACST